MSKEGDPHSPNLSCDLTVLAKFIKYLESRRIVMVSA